MKTTTKARYHKKSHKRYTTRLSAAKSGGPRGELPKKLETKWSKIFDAIYDVTKDKARAARIAWYQIEKVWKKNKNGKWVRRSK